MSEFGLHLKRWRRTRGVSQLDLSTRAHVSQRHISFLETGRSRPSREMVTHLGTVLEVPLREQNVMLAAAGFAPAFTEVSLADLDHVSGVLQTILSGHEPHVAVVVDRRWDVVMSNAAAALLMSEFFTEVPGWLTPPPNLMRLSFHPEGLRAHMVDWERTAGQLLRRLEGDAALHPSDKVLQGLLDELRGYPGVDRLGSPQVPAAHDLVLPITYRLDDGDVALFSTITTIGDAHDVTLSELRLETFWPADPGSAEVWAGFVERRLS